MTEPLTGARRQLMNNFLAARERRAFAIAQVAVGNPDDALELVQEAMLKLVQKYSAKPEAEWAPLFHRILQSKIRDWYRRSKVKNRIFSWFHGSGDDDQYYGNFIEQAAAPKRSDPVVELDLRASSEQLVNALGTLSNRQQQAFMLRVWEGLDVRETAHAMQCSEGTVKTHYSRAVHALREHLQDWKHE